MKERSQCDKVELKKGRIFNLIGVIVSSCPGKNLLYESTFARQNLSNFSKGGGGRGVIDYK